VVRALELSYALINTRERTVCEVRRHLVGKGVSTEVVDTTVEILCDQGLLDDRRFAELFAADKRELEQWGSERIRISLAARGVESDLVQAVLAETEQGDGDGGGEGELDRALGVLRRRFPTPPQDRRERDRALGVLLRKGYKSELALDALREYTRVNHV
jgi:regulatory protein